MIEQRWIVEVVLPEGSVETRAILPERTLEELDQAVRASVTEVLDWRPEDETPVRDLSRLYYETHSHLQSRRRLLIAHSCEPELAERISNDLKQLIPTSRQPWTETARMDFLEYMESLFKGPSETGKS